MLINKSWYIKPKNKELLVRTGAGGVIVRKEKDKVLVGLVKGDRFTKYTIVKGGKDGEESMIETARREIKEETGITDLKLLMNLGICERLTFGKDYWSKMHYFLFLTQQKDGIPTDPVENFEVEWFDIDNLPPMFWPEQRKLIEKNRGKIKKLLSRKLF